MLTRRYLTAIASSWILAAATLLLPVEVSLATDLPNSEWFDRALTDWSWGEPVPLGCGLAWGHDTETGIVKFVGPVAYVAGIRPGDHVLLVDGVIPYDRKQYSLTLRRHKPGDDIPIVFLREGEKRTTSVKCRDHAEIDRLLQTIYSPDSQEKDCFDACRVFEAREGRSSWIGQRTVFCYALDAWPGGALPPGMNESAYEFRRRKIFEMRHVPGGLDRIRAEILSFASMLAREGESYLAEDLKTLLNSLSERNEWPTPSLPSIHAQSRGTCFAVGPGGLILTAHHVVAEATRIEIECAGVGKVRAKIERVSAANDLALLRAPLRMEDYVPLAPPRSVKSGQQVFTIGFPAEALLGGEPKFTEGVVSSLSGPGGEASLMQITVPVQPGNSGGPLVTMRGELAGVITSTAAVAPFIRETGSLPQNVNWAISVEYVRPLVGEVASLEAAKTRDEAIQRVRKSVCTVTAMQN